MAAAQAAFSARTRLTALLKKTVSAHILFLASAFAANAAPRARLRQEKNYLQLAQTAA